MILLEQVADKQADKEAAAGSYISHGKAASLVAWHNLALAEVTFRGPAGALARPLVGHADFPVGVVAAASYSWQPSAPCI